MTIFWRQKILYKYLVRVRLSLHLLTFAMRYPMNMGNMMRAKQALNWVGYWIKYQARIDL